MPGLILHVNKLSTYALENHLEDDYFNTFPLDRAFTLIFDKASEATAKLFPEHVKPSCDYLSQKAAEYEKQVGLPDWQEFENQLCVILDEEIKSYLTDKTKTRESLETLLQNADRIEAEAATAYNKDKSEHLFIFMFGLFKNCLESYLANLPKDLIKKPEDAKLVDILQANNNSKGPNYFFKLAICLNWRFRTNVEDQQKYLQSYLDSLLGKDINYIEVLQSLAPACKDSDLAKKMFAYILDKHILELTKNYQTHLINEKSENLSFFSRRRLEKKIEFLGEFLNGSISSIPQLASHNRSLFQSDSKTYDLWGHTFLENMICADILKINKMQLSKLKPEDTAFFLKHSEYWPLMELRDLLKLITSSEKTTDLLLQSPELREALDHLPSNSKGQISYNSCAAHSILAALVELEYLPNDEATFSKELEIYRAIWQKPGEIATPQKILNYFNQYQDAFIISRLTIDPFISKKLTDIHFSIQNGDETTSLAAKAIKKSYLQFFEHSSSTFAHKHASQFFNAEEPIFPANALILLVIDQGSAPHVIIGINKKDSFLIIDPADGKETRYESFHQFMRNEDGFSGVSFVINSKNALEKEK